MVKVSQLTPLAAVLSGLASAASPQIGFCTDVNFGGTCINFPIVSDTCVDFKGGLTLLYHEVSSVIVPAGFICELYHDYGCTSSSITLLQGRWKGLFSVPNGSGSTMNFNDLTASFSCSPI
ncbi:uncharacterized protein BDW43DRAFT_293490 [Aspergillus alliaceus]|uniref:uncharacterized protein n=1 Tax=Petromyces alliaceus TaxID=209559 RepID=UPI0012A5417C|nr:uncharacterized protein BDW43DRAFT_293490 [Aspergillus alliaceus]KAB8227700.1 hypothetical protein BDW43DRAFT_293490 [Aspergillus alliaceus]